MPGQKAYLLVNVNKDVNSVDPDQTARMSSLIWIYTVCQRSFKNMSADDESRRLAVIGTSRVNKCEFSVYTAMIFMKFGTFARSKQRIHQVFNQISNQS